MASVGGVCCCVGAAIVYVTGVSLGGEAGQLESVYRVSKLSDLATLWDAASTLFPLVVAVSGWVGSDNPIECQGSDVKCVIVETRDERYISKRDEQGIWKEEPSFAAIQRQVVGLWYLDDGTSHLRVSGALCSSGLPLISGGDVFEKSIISPREEILEENGSETRRIKKIERVLPVGTYMTVVGEVVKDGRGTFSIEKPSQGGPFYVSYKTLGQLIEDLKSPSRICKYVAAGLAVIGGCLIVTAK